jgi:hypothetical protein
MVVKEMIIKIKEMISDWKHTQIEKQVLKKKQEIKILESEIRRIKLELANLNYSSDQQTTKEV